MQGLASRLSRLSFSSNSADQRNSQDRASRNEQTDVNISRHQQEISEEYDHSNAGPLMQEPEPQSAAGHRPVMLLDIPRTASTSSLASSVVDSPVEQNGAQPKFPARLMSRATSGTNSSTASSFSRQSSVRSTDSVDAVPLKTPLRTPAVSSPMMSRHNTGVGPVPSYFLPKAASVEEFSNRQLTSTAENGGSNAIEPLPTIYSPSSGVLSTESEDQPVQTAPNSPTMPSPPQPSQNRFTPLPLSMAQAPPTASLRISLPRMPTGTEMIANASSLPSTPDGIANSNLLKPTRPGVISRTASSMSVGVNVRTSSNDFDFGDILGEGSYSTVFSVLDRFPPHRKYALKVLDKRHIVKERKQKYVNIEKDTLNRLHRHPGIVRLFYTFHDERSLYFVLELAENGEILKLIKKHGSFDLDSAKFYAAQILSAVGHIHSRGVIHRDLKPENILLDNNMRIKITDFGTAKMLAPGTENNPAEDRANSFVGTAEYVSPELLTSKTAYKSSDFWALGCIIYQMIAGKVPFKAPNEYLTFKKIIDLDYTFPDNFPPDAKDLVEKLLIRDPLLRLGGNGEGVAAIQDHAFFDGIDFSGLWTCPVPTITSGLVPAPPQVTPSFEIFHSSSDYFGYRDDTDSENMNPPNANFNKEDSLNSSAESISGPKSNGRELPSPIPLAVNKWSAPLLPNEMILQSGPVVYRTGFFSKKRHLILTDMGRLLCIKEMPQSVKVKIEVLVGAGGKAKASAALILPPGKARHLRTSSAASMEPLQIMTKVEEDGSKGFKVYTNAKSYRFEDSNHDMAIKWLSAIREAHNPSGAA